MAEPTDGAHGPRARRVLVVGQGAPGGIGRVEQLLAEAAVADTAAGTRAWTAVWRSTHPDYLREGTALESVSTFPTSGHSMPAFARTVARAVRQFRPDHVMYTHVNLARLALPLRAVGHPKDYSVWTYGVEVWDRRSKLHRLGLAGARGVATISTFTANATRVKQSVPAGSITTIPLSLPSAAFASAPSEDAAEPGRILAVSRLDKTEAGKNLDFLIRAMPAVLLQHPDAKLVVVGEGAARPDLEREVVSAGVVDAVTFTGRLSDEALELEYEKADIFALPSEKEGFGLVFIEAMLRHTPVVALAAGGTVDVVRDGLDGRLISSLDELPSALIGLLSDRPQLDRVRRTTRARVEQAFSPKRFRDDVSAFLA